ncbi:MAG: DUF5985 family protein [Thermodesulfobacteriota bacterium]
MAKLVYILCALTSLACAVLLWRAFVRTRARLLLWSGLCFLCLSLNNALLYVDVAVVPTLDLAIYRSLPVMVGLAVLIYGLIWEVE